MLPDFLVFKERQARTIALSVSAGEGLVAKIQRSAIHEGESFIIARADGSRTRQEMVLISEKVEIPTETIRSGDVQAFKKVLAGLRQSVSARQTKMLLETAGEAAESVGNVTDAGGRPISAELLLESFKTIELSFDDEGNWDMPTMVMHPAMAEVARRELDRLFTEPGLKERIQAVVEKGRQKWRDREGSRKLVD